MAGQPAGPHDWISFANALASLKELIANVDSGPVHLAGISFGAMIAQTMVLAYPELVRSLTLIGTAAAFPEGVRSAMRARAQATRDGGMQAVLQPSLDRWFTSQTVTQRPDLIDRVSKTVLGADPVVHAAIWELIANDFDVVARLGEIACPALIVVGEPRPEHSARCRIRFGRRHSRSATRRASARVAYGDARSAGCGQRTRRAVSVQRMRRSRPTHSSDVDRHTRSRSMAMPCPTPMHMVQTA